MSACLFCKLSHHHSQMLFEDEDLFVINDITPQAPVHQLIIPKLHIATLNDLTTDHQWLMGHMIYIAQKQAFIADVSQTGFRTVFNCNQEGGQAIYHIHLHLVGGRALTWPPG